MTAIQTLPTDSVAVAPRSPVQLMADLLYMAVEKGLPVAELKELVALHGTMSQQQAQQDYAAAMARFQAECPSIKKSSTANFATRGGGAMSYTFAALDEIAATVNPILARHGLSYTWDSTVTGSALTCTCTVRHCNGFSTSSTITLPTDSASAMSSQQKVGSALTFARRLSLTSALGLTSTDDDMDGRDTGRHAETITDDQATELSDLIAETRTKVDSFLKFFKIGQVADLPATRYAEAQRMLQQRRGGA